MNLFPLDTVSGYGLDVPYDDHGRWRLDDQVLESGRREQHAAQPDPAPPDTSEGTIAAIFTDFTRNDYGEVCVYCHTPHGANTTTAVPLWNRPEQRPPDRRPLPRPHCQHGLRRRHDHQWQPVYNTGGGFEVECAPCHDPHGVPSAGAGSPFIGTFLRIANAESALCLTCHTK